MFYFNSSQEGTDLQAVAANAPPVSQNLPQSPAAQTFDYTVFKSEKDNIPQSNRRTWKDFALFMEQHRPRKTKEGTGVFSPVTYRKGTTRGNNGVEAITMAVFDVDGGVTPEVVKSILDGFSYIQHSTWSHSFDKPSYRVIVPFTTPVPKQDWPQIWARLNLFIGAINDPATKDPARIYYLPSHPVGREDYFVEIGDGKFLDPNELPVLPVAKAPELLPASVNVIDSHHDEELGAIEQLTQVQRRCQFIQWASSPENQPTVSEPLWAALISNLCRFEGGDVAIHQASCHHPEYDETKTETKLDRLRESAGPITCERIRSLGFKGCPEGGCKTTSGKVTKAPAGLGCWGLPIQTSNAGLGKPEYVVDFLGMEFPAGLYYTNESFYAYQRGVWSSQDERADIRRKIAEFYGEEASPDSIKGTLSLLKDFQAVREADINQNKHLICLRNGTLDTNSYQLIEHSPSHGLMTKTNIDWMPDATCPRWLQFLDEIFVNDLDKAEKISFVQEWLGYCLIPDCSQHKFLWMVGAGGNGKSVLLDILRHLVGPANVSDAHIERLGEKFVRAELEGKLVNISAEMGAESTIADGYLKSIVAGDVIEAERKFKPSFSFRPFVKLVGSTNHLPRLLDLSEGFFRRAIVLAFNRRFSDEDRDPNLINKLIEELPGILVWAVQGLRNLRERGQFAIPSSSVEALKQYRTDSDPEAMFFEECLILDPEGNGMTPNDAYSGYVVWCRASGYRPKAKNNFGKRLADLGAQYHRGHAGKRWLVKPNPESWNVWNETDFYWADQKASPEKMIATDGTRQATTQGNTF